MDPVLAETLEAESSAALPEAAPGRARVEALRIWQPAGGTVAVSRIVGVAADHGGRPARLAHHAVVDADRDAADALAGILLDDASLLDTWTGTPREDPPRPAPRAGAPARESAREALRALTEHAGAWAAHLAELASARGGAPAAVLVPEGTAMRPLLAAIVEAAADPTRLRVETLADRVATARPSLLVLWASARPAGMAVVADWSARRGTDAPPDRPAVPAPPPTTRRPAPATAELDLSGLPSPPGLPGAATGDRRGSPARPPRSSPRPARGSTLPVIACYALGAVAGAAAVALAWAAWR